MHVNNFNRQAQGFKFGGSLHDYPQRGTVGNHRGVGARPKYLRTAKGHREAAQVGGQGLFEAVAVEALDDHGRFVGLKQGIVHSRSLNHAARGAEVHAAQGAEQQLHGGSAVPNSLEAVAPGADN